MEFLMDKANQCPRCKSENLKKYDDKAECENCHAKFELFKVLNEKSSE